MFAETLLRQARQQHPANPKVHLGTLTFRDQRIGRLLNPIVEEGIRSLHAKDQPGADGFQKRSVNPLFGLSEDHTQGRDLGHVPETGELLESGLRMVSAIAGASPPSDPPRCRSSPWRESDPGPRSRPARTPVEPEQTFLNQRREELDCKERIATGLLIDQQRQRTSGVRPAVQGIGDEPLNVIEPERRQHDFLCSLLPPRGSRPASA